MLPLELCAGLPKMPALELGAGPPKILPPVPCGAPPKMLPAEDWPNIELPLDCGGAEPNEKIEESD
jgi:hypothetical protein